MSPSEIAPTGHSAAHAPQATQLSEITLGITYSSHHILDNILTLGLFFVKSF
jgi:hypothetical protein